jgi:8-oxo-dGTP pyrophosphatase MutT (NUDIX family)
VVEGREDRTSSLGLNKAVVRAAGGVVARDADGNTEVLLVHRPRYDDWTFPKGKAFPGESDEDCALREVEEETGLRCVLGPELPRTSYPTGGARLKVVRYWLMRPSGGEARARHEVDDVRWLALAHAAALLSYERDRKVLAAAVDGLEGT